MAIDDNAEYQGLFGYNKGTIRNIGVEGEEIQLSKIAGVIVGFNEGTIESCYNKVNIVSDELDTIGGIVGKTQGGTINRCYNSGNLRCNTSTKFGSACGIVGSNVGR